LHLLNFQYIHHSHEVQLKQLMLQAFPLTEHDRDGQLETHVFN